MADASVAECDQVGVSRRMERDADAIPEATIELRARRWAPAPKRRPGNRIIP